MVGGTAGAAIYEGLRHLHEFQAGTTMVVIVCDAGEKYLDTIFDTDWLQKNHLYSEVMERQVSRMLRAYGDSRAIANSFEVAG
ncbi:hypothetical protein QP838_10715 [Corynebacterium amycolatum]|nr:hypothetical protein [Corynebacterium amycolatum]MDK8728173.1 hypothetical protein [Corynebacterium amycolatum]